MAYFVYILECADGTFYTGSTNDLKKRVSAHNGDKGAKTGARYTKSRRPVTLRYSEEFKGKNNKSRALKREYSLKQLSRVEKASLVTLKQRVHNKK